MRITALRLDEFGVGRYRITNPLTELEKRGHSVNIIQAEYGLRMRSDWFHGDILIIQRMNDPIIYQLVGSIPEAHRPKVVYEIDDLLWDNPLPKQGRELAEDWQRTVPTMIRRADCVTCSTPELSSKCRELNGEVFTVRNGIDFGLRDWEAKINRPSETEGKVVIGWSGSGWHEGDFDVIGKALRKVMLDYHNTFLILQGDAPNMALWVQSLRIPPKRMCLVNWMPLDEHPSVYSLFDIGLAPLANTAYNRCKSELKLMELGAAKLPYVASNVSPYRRFNNLCKSSGFLASTVEDWYNCLEYLILMEQRRAEMGLIGYDFVRKEYNLSSQTDELELALRFVLANDNQRIVPATM